MVVDGPEDDKRKPLFEGDGASVNLGEDSLLVMGGVNKEVFLAAVNHPQPDYLTHPVEWYRFNPYTLLYSKEGWRVIGESAAIARAGAALVLTEQGLYVIGGELKPRVRSSSVVKYTVY